MSYLSLGYYALVLVAALLYYLCPQKIRWTILLTANIAFYCAVIGNQYMQGFVFAGSIAVSYLAGRLIAALRERDGAKSVVRLALAGGILFSAGPLLLSKASELLWSVGTFKARLNLIVPIGLSFYTMQIIAYLADIYRGEIRPEKNPLKYALFISFFPTVVQGPISRYSQLADQLCEGHSYDGKGFMGGVQLILWGFFLKYMIADKASVVVNQVFAHYAIYSGGVVLFAGVLYSIQLYTDFLACVTISQGVAALFGIRLTDNFARPYFSTSIKDFWRRWHISLSTWLRDYVYILLGGNRGGLLRKFVNLTLTFTVSGIWHGGSIKYLCWGLMHAGYQICGELLRKPKERLCGLFNLPKESKVRKLIGMGVTSFLVMLAWIIFRAETLTDGFRMIHSIFANFYPWVFFDNTLLRLGLNQKELEVLFLAILLLLGVSALQERGVRIRDWFAKQNTAFRWLVYLCAIWSIWVFGTYGYGFNAADFIYGGF